MINHTMENVGMEGLSFGSLTTESYDLQVVSQTMGWVYFFAWAVCFYPQIYENCKRKSVVGYSFDFLTLDTIDLSLYSAYNIGMYASSLIQDQYKKKHHTEDIPVKINDLGFSAHAVFCCAVLIVQTAVYERGKQTVSKSCITVVGIIFLFVLCVMSATTADSLEWVDFLTYISYVKIATTVKYIPQVMLNFKRKSTEGFNIGLAFLDFTGGSFSVGQMMVDSYNKNDWSSLKGNPTKLGVGIVSIFFDIILVIQFFMFRKKVPHVILTNADVEEEHKEV